MKVTVVWEANCYEKEPNVASVWILPGHDYELYSDLTECEGAVRLMGPVDHRLCAEVQERLVQVLRSLGHDVRSETSADD